MLKVWAVLKRLRQERAPDWLKAMRKESRPEYNKLVDQCALFKAKHHKSDPLYALYRCAATQDGQCRFLALSPTRDRRRRASWSCATPRASNCVTR